LLVPEDLEDKMEKELLKIAKKMYGVEAG